MMSRGRSFRAPFEKGNGYPGNPDNIKYILTGSCGMSLERVKPGLKQNATVLTSEEKVNLPGAVRKNRSKRLKTRRTYQRKQLLIKNRSLIVKMQSESL